MTVVFHWMRDKILLLSKQNLEETHVSNILLDVGTRLISSIASCENISNKRIMNFLLEM